MSTPSPPFYTIPNMNNLRDAALTPLTTSKGHSIRPAILFRSAEVSKIDHFGWLALHALGVAHVFDLRSKPEVDRGWSGTIDKDSAAASTTDVQPSWISAMQKAGVQRSWVPVFKESDYSPERLAERYVKYMGEDVLGFVEAYEDILRSGGEAYREIFMYLAGLPAPAAPAAKDSEEEEEEKEEEEKLGVLIHCTAGKDRTGIFFGILFDFLGVPREQIAHEYNLTELGLRHVRDEVVARLMQSPGFKRYTLAQMQGGGTALSAKDVAASMGEQQQGTTAADEEVVIPPEIMEKGRQAALRMVGARKESMLRSLEMVDRVFGGAEAYMRNECGLGDDELDRLRRNLVLKP